MTKSRRMRWASHLAHNEGTEDENKISAEKTKGKVLQDNKGMLGKKDVERWVTLIQILVGSI